MMRSQVEIDSGKPGQLRKVLKQSLESGEKISYSLKEKDQAVKIDVRTEGLGQLRGCTDTVFRLTSLAKKILER